MPDTCDVCSSHMSPLPHPHTPGNMWVGKCDYITKLIDPFALKESKLPINFEQDTPCKGFGRHFFEHWIHSHPYVQPCDLYNEKRFKFGYSDIPNGNFTKNFTWHVVLTLIIMTYRLVVSFGSNTWQTENVTMRLFKILLN